MGAAPSKAPNDILTDHNAPLDLPVHELPDPRVVQKLQPGDSPNSVQHKELAAGDAASSCATYSCHEHEHEHGFSMVSAWFQSLGQIERVRTGLHWAVPDAAEPEAAGLVSITCPSHSVRTHSPCFGHQRNAELPSCSASARHILQHDAWNGMCTGETHRWIL